jgi:hypothetical protein
MTYGKQKPWPDVNSVQYDIGLEVMLVMSIIAGG